MTPRLIKSLISCCFGSRMVRDPRSIPYAAGDTHRSSPANAGLYLVYLSLLGGFNSISSCAIRSWKCNEVCKSSMLFSFSIALLRWSELSATCLFITLKMSDSRGTTTTTTAAARTKTRTGRRPCQQRQLQGRRNQQRQLRQQPRTTVAKCAS